MLHVTKTFILARYFILFFNYIISKYLLLLILYWEIYVVLMADYLEIMLNVQQLAGNYSINLLKKTLNHKIMLNNIFALKDIQ